MDEKRVAFLFPYNTWGGAYRSTYELTNRLENTCGYSVDIIFPFLAPQITSNEITLGKKILVWFKSFMRSVIRGKRIPWFDVKASVRMIPFISDRYLKEYDLVVANHWHTLRPVHRLNIEAKKFIYVRDIETFEHYYDKQLEDFRLPLTKICVASWIKEFLLSKGYDVHHVLVNGTNTKPFINDRDRSLPTERVIIGMCYATHNAKDMPGGINVLKRIKEKYQDIEIYLYGFPRDPKLDFEYTYFHRPVGENLRNIYRDIDIFFCPSIQEGFHNPPREAMAAKCCVVATDVGCIPDIGVNEVNMMKVDPRDYSGMVTALSLLIENKDLRLELGNSGFETIQSQGWSSVKENFIKIIESDNLL